jgi:hypothetical protein
LTGPAGFDFQNRLRYRLVGVSGAGDAFDEWKLAQQQGNRAALEFGRQIAFEDGSEPVVEIAAAV